MSVFLNNKIEATDKSVSELLSEQKFFIDSFQREYRWQEKHIKLLIEDLTTAFLKNYKNEHERRDVEKYSNYYLGPVVFSSIDGKKSIVDGQQRITSITLILIYLYHLQIKMSSTEVEIKKMIFSEKYGTKSFNMTDESRQDCLESLLNNGVYEIKDSDDETVRNMLERYNDIDNAFPEEINTIILPYFIDWLKENVKFVEILAYSEESAYKIFETMNDRGLNLTPTEMLKGYILSKISDKKQDEEVNKIWKNEIQQLHIKVNETADITFFQSWFRAKYATSIREGKTGSEDKDFEIIGPRFHNWFKDNHIDSIKIEKSEQFIDFIKRDFVFFSKIYLKIKNAQKKYNKNLENLFYIGTWGIAESLQDALLLSPINIDDNDNVIDKKLNFVAKFIETFTVRRSLNFRKFGASSIKYTMFNLIKKIRNNSIEELSLNLIEETNNLDTTFDNLNDFYMHSQNKRFIKHYLSRITTYINNLSGGTDTYEQYMFSVKNSKPFEIEHIWADKFENHKKSNENLFTEPWQKRYCEFEQENEFIRWRNSIGALLLLPNGTNQSYGSLPFEEKISHYIKENSYVKTLSDQNYYRNTNFTNNEELKSFNFKPYNHFYKENIIERCEVLKKISESLWSNDYYKDINNE